MATDRSFSSMLNEYLPYELLRAEMIKKVWLFNKCKKDDTWLGGNLVVPFQGAGASSVSWGSLTAEADIAEDQYVRGNVSAYKEMWGTMKFKSTDLKQHGKLSDQNFLKLLPDTLDRFVDLMKERASLVMMNGYASLANADGVVGGTIGVKNPERFCVGEKVYVDDDNSAPVVGYITAINQNTGVLTIQTARSGGVAVDLSAYTVAQNAKLYYDGTQPGSDNGFTSLRSQLLSAANGGASTQFGVTKTAWSFLQATQISGSGVTASNILDRIFAGYVKVANRGSSNPNQIVMSFKNLASCMQQLEGSKGAYHINQQSSEVTSHNWKTIQIGSVKGDLELVGVQEMEDDLIYYLDPKRSVTFHSNGMIKRETSPDNNQFYTVRAQSGYTYIVDHSLFGELVVSRPSDHGVMHSVNFSLTGTDDTGA